MFGNRLRGELPADWSRLKKLRNLSLGQNRIDGEIPASLGSVKTLRNISLDNNLLRGVIPTTLGHLKELLALVLSTDGSDPRRVIHFAEIVSSGIVG